MYDYRKEYIADVIERAAARDAAEARAEARRYEPVRCAACGGTFQRIDFYGNPHAAFCHAVEAVDP